MSTKLLILVLEQTTHLELAVWRQQATACPGSAWAAGPEDGPQPEAIKDDALVLGLAMVWAGPSAGRSAKTDQTADAAFSGEDFSVRCALKPEALEAQRAGRGRSAPNATASHGAPTS